MPTRPVLLLIGALPATLMAQSNRDDMTPLDVAYTLTVLDDLKTLRVQLDVGHLTRPVMRVAMPNWSPGAYGIRGFGSGIKTLSARSGEKTIEVSRLDQQTWSIDTTGQRSVRLSYDVVPRRRGLQGRRGGEPRTGMQVSGPGTFVYVAGAKDRPVTVRYHVPKDWKIANGLRETADPMVRQARNYDTFIDAPTTLGIFKSFDFEVAGTPFQCVFFQNSQLYQFDLEAFVGVCRKIVTSQGQLYGSYPFPNYVFLFTIPGGGGLEHLNSTSIGLNPDAMAKDVRAGASVTAHEFFHTWNVKRIRPKALGPFEYEHENYTGNLWVSEGWTSYYGDLTLVRTKIRTPEEFLGLFRSYIQREMNKEGRKLHSVYWASRNVWHRKRGEPSRVDYYAKGELLGAMIDLKIRHETKNRKSLDDVMRFMNRWFAERGVGFEEGDMERACTAVSNYDFSDFFARHVRGTLDPPMREYFGYAGVEYTEHHGIAAALPFRTRRSRNGLQVTSNSNRVPQTGDRIVSLGVLSRDGAARVRPASFLADKKPGQKIKVAFEHNGAAAEIEVELIQRDMMTPTLRFAANPTELQQRIRVGWLTGK